MSVSYSHATLNNQDSLNREDNNNDKIDSMDMDRDNSKRRKLSSQSSLESYISKISTTQKKSIDMQVGRFIYATNLPFRTVDHPQFIKLVQDLQPAYKPPKREDVGGRLLDSVYEEQLEACAQKLKGENVCLSLDGWSNIHNDSIICVAVTTKTGDTYLIDTVDTSVNAHNAEYLAKIATESIKNCQQNLQCNVSSLVTDNAANVSKMRSLISENTDFNIIAYGCSAHVMNLLANDIKYPRVKEQIVRVIKYFRNNHFANASFQEAKGKNAVKLMLPSEVRWNSIVDSLESYIKGWPILLQICEQHRGKIDKDIKNLVSDFNLKRNAEDMLQQLKPIADALDAVQKDNCSISIAVKIWKELKKKLEHIKVSKEIMNKFELRYNMALTPAHFLAYMLDPNEKEEDMELSREERNSAMEFSKKSSSKYLLQLTVKFLAKAEPFEKFFFEEEVIKGTTLYEWWKSQEKQINKFHTTVFTDVEQLLTAQASSAGIERVFSTFGLVQSKLRNRLGTEKASKLVFLHKMFNNNA